MRQYRTLNDVYALPLTAGVFHSLSNLQGVTMPWDGSPDDLDIQYHGNHSGNKIISPLVSTLLADGETLSADAVKQIAAVLWTMYGLNWSKRWDALTAEYELLDNVTEDTYETYTKKNTGTQGTANSGTVITDHTGTQGTANSGTIVTDHTGTQGEVETLPDEKRDTGIYGFNSSEASDSDTETVSYQNDRDKTRTDNLHDTVTRADGSTRTDNLHDTVTRSDGSTRTDNLTEHYEYQKNRHGNIGVTSSQQMITQELELRSASYYESVMKDIDSVLCLSVY